jgi:predicted nucleic-acid-binding Zn-ribbon protein
LPALLRACPDCGNEDVRRVPRVMTGGGMTGTTFLALRWGEISSVGRFEAHVCRKCGHTTFYLADPEALDKLRTE